MKSKSNGLRRILAMLMSAALVLSCMPVSISAVYAEGEEAPETITYTYKFSDGLDNTVIAEGTAEAGSKLTRPEAPKHEGYTFDGWSVADEKMDNLQEDLDIKAKYEKDEPEATDPENPSEPSEPKEETKTEYSYKFIDGTNGNIIKEGKAEEGSSLEVPEAPEHDGYKFTGWSASDAEMKNIQKDLEITANYDKIKQYTVKFDEGDVGFDCPEFKQPDDDKTDANEEGAYEIPGEETRSKEYTTSDGKTYYFDGWKYGDKEYKPGDKVTFKEDVALEASWKQTYHIKFNTDDVEEETLWDVVGVFGEDVKTDALHRATSSKQGYTFKGWTPDEGKTVFELDGEETEIKASDIEPKNAEEGPFEVELTAVLKDETAPAITFEPEAKDKKISSSKINVTVSDDGAGLKTIEYVVSENAEAPSGDWTSVAIDEGTAKKEIEEITVPYKSYLYVKASDAATPANSSADFIQVWETTSPVVEITSTTPKIDSDKPEQTLEVEYKVSDKEPSSGIRHIRAYVSEEELDADNIDEEKDKIQETIELEDSSEQADGSLVGNVEFKDLDGKYFITIVAEDVCGNRGSDQVSCWFDSTKPEVSSIVMNGGIEADSTYYYKADNCGITVTANDDNLAEIAVTVKGGDKTETFKETTFEEETKGTLAISAEDLAKTFGEYEGEVEVGVVATDAAGNRSDELKEVSGLKKGTDTLSFILDTVSPKLETVATESEAEGLGPYEDSNYYYSKEAETEYAITETYPDSLVLTYAKDGETSEPVDAGTEKSVKGEWNEEATYTDIKVTAKDKAGNVMVAGEPSEDADTYNVTEEGTAEFKYGKVIDLTNPTATITYTAEGATPYLYSEGEEGSEALKAYVNHAVSASVVIEDNESLDLSRIMMNEAPFSNTDTVKPVGEAGLEKKAELKGLDAGTDEGEYRYVLCGTDRAGHPLEVTEVMDGVEEITGTWPADASEYNGEDKKPLTVTFVLDTIPPKYTSSQEAPKDKDAIDGSVSYYGNDYIDTENNTSRITASFVITDENLLYKENLGAGYVRKDIPEKGHVKDIQNDFEWGDGPELGNATTDEEAKSLTYDVTLPIDDGAYRFTITGSDKAGNLLVPSEAEEEIEELHQQTESAGDDEGCFWSMIKVIDTEAPEVTISMEDFFKLVIKGLETDTTNRKYDQKTYEPFQQKNKTVVEVLGSDKSPVKVYYEIAYDMRNASPTSEKVDSGVYADDDKPIKFDTESIPGEEEGIQLSVKNLQVKDRAGNVTDLNESSNVYLDRRQPDASELLNEDKIKPFVKIAANASVTARTVEINGKATNIYNVSPILDFAVNDPNPGKSSSGLKSVSYAIYVNGELLKEGYENVEAKESTNPILFDSEAAAQSKLNNNKSLKENVKLYGDKALEYEHNSTIKVKSFKDSGKKLFESNNVRVVLTATDNAGNTSSASETFGIDTIAPTVDIDVAGTSARGNEYFNSNRLVTVKVTDRNFGNNNNAELTLHIERDGNDESVKLLSAKSFKRNKGSDESGNNDTWTTSFTLSKDGDYRLRMASSDCKDALGNAAKSSDINFHGSYSTDFTIDKTAPIIRTVTFDNNNVRNRKYYKANRTATVRIDERNFDAKDVEITPKNAKTLRKANMAFPGLGAFSASGYTHAARIPFTKEGIYSFGVKFQDRAGNPAKVVNVDEFVIDKTAPVIRIENVVNGGIYGGTVAPRAIFDDDTFNRSESIFRFTGAGTGDRSDLSGGFRSSGEYGGSYVMSDFAHVRHNDDIYTAYAQATDMAGNSTTVQVSFSVNRFGSTFDYNNNTTTENYVGRRYNNEKSDLVLREININPLKSYTVTLTQGSNKRTLEEGKDYTVGKQTTDKGSQYIYRINKDVITDEGSYNIVVRSEDEAGNINTNAAIRSEGKKKEVPLKFVYDTTPPTVSFKNMGENSSTLELVVKDEGRNKFRGMKQLVLGLVPEDDWTPAAIQYVIKSGDKIISDSGVISGDEFWDVMGENGKRVFDEKTIIESGIGYKTLEVTVWDAAGNETKQTYEFSVTSNAGQTALQNWYWILLALAAGGGGYAYYRHRRDDDDEEEDEDDAA